MFHYFVLILKQTIPIVLLKYIKMQIIIPTINLTKCSFFKLLVIGTCLLSTDDPVLVDFSLNRGFSWSREKIYRSHYTPEKFYYAFTSAFILALVC